MKLHTIAETLVLPVALKMVKAMCGEEEAQKVMTIQRRVDAIAAN